jgi:hypothetical protein
MSEYTQPEVKLGDAVYWYNDPTNIGEPTLGWICRRPGSQTVTILVFAPNIGFLEKPSVRHVSDPGLQENPSWRQWGCWDFSEQTKIMGKLSAATADLIASSEKKARKPTNAE